MFPLKSPRLTTKPWHFHWLDGVMQNGRWDLAQYRDTSSATTWCVSRVLQKGHGLGTKNFYWCSLHSTFLYILPFHHNVVPFYVYMRMVQLNAKCLVQMKAVCWTHHITWGVLCQEPVSRTGTSNYIRQILWDVITCPCPWYLLLAQHPSYVHTNT